MIFWLVFIMTYFSESLRQTFETFNPIFHKLASINFRGCGLYSRATSNISKPKISADSNQGRPAIKGGLFSMQYGINLQSKKGRPYP